MSDNVSEGCTLESYSRLKGLPVESLRTYGLYDSQSSGRPSVAIPYHDCAGELVAVRHRIAMDGDRFRWRKGDTPIPYGLWKLAQAREGGFIILVEGESDCHTLWHYGLPAIGIPGASVWRNEWVPYLDGIEQIDFVREPDDASARLLAKLHASELRDRIWVVELDGHKDPSELHCADPDGFPAAWAKAKAAAFHPTEDGSEA